MKVSALTVSGAYGRDYKTKAAALADWEANKDFYNRSPFTAGTYVNKSSAIAAGLKEIHIRYNRDMSVVIVKL